MDDIKDYKNFKFTRLSYFYLNLSSPEEFNLVFSDQNLPIALVEMEGVIISGIRRNTVFYSASIIEELFDFIYDETSFVVSTGYIWLPNSLINFLVKDRIHRRSVLRIDFDLFAEATRNFLTPEKIEVKKWSERETTIQLSHDETQAFSEWTEMTVERVKQRYHNMDSNNLRNRK